MKKRQELIRKMLYPQRPQRPDYPRCLQILRGIRMVAFDVYGTLLTSAIGEVGSINAEEKGLREVAAFSKIDKSFLQSIQRRYYAIIQKQQKQKIRAMVPQAEVEIREVWKECLSPFLPECIENHTFWEEVSLRYELAANPVWLMPEAYNTVRMLKKQNMPLAIISNAQFYTPVIIEALFGTSLKTLGFSLTVWSYQEQAAKPSPYIFQRFLEQIPSHMMPSEILYVGNDMLNDVYAAQKAGLRTALFAGDAASLRLREDDQRIVQTKPNAVLSSLKELLYILKI